MQHSHPVRLGRRALAVAAAAALAVLAGCSGAGTSDVAGAGATASQGSRALNVYAFSVAKPALDALGTAFAATPDGSGVTLTASYGASGDQSRKVAAGAPADVVSFSIEPDVTRLVEAGLVAADWKSGAYQGTPFGSVVVLVVRKGNPKKIHDWADLLQPGISVVTPNPLSSGSAQWNLLAPYASYSKGGKDSNAGLAYVEELVDQHVHSRPGSGSEATELFRQGTGDVLLSYENEALAAIQAGDDFEYLVPPETFKIQNALAVVSNSTQQDAARSFVDYVSSQEGQETVAKAGYRPADAAVLAAHPEFKAPTKLWTIDDLGGWPAVTASLFDKTKGAITGLYSKASQ